MCRFVFHHFEYPAHVLAEMCRVCRSGATIAVEDLYASEFPPRASYYNQLERLRDHSHTRALAPVLKALGCKLLYKPRTPHADALGSLEALLAEVDILSQHLPLTSETHHLIDAAAIRRMRRGAVLINTAVANWWIRQQ